MPTPIQHSVRSNHAMPASDEVIAAARSIEPASPDVVPTRQAGLKPPPGRGSMPSNALVRRDAANESRSFPFFADLKPAEIVQPQPLGATQLIGRINGTRDGTRADIVLSLFGGPENELSAAPDIDPTALNRTLVFKPEQVADLVWGVALPRLAAKGVLAATEAFATIVGLSQKPLRWGQVRLNVSSDPAEQGHVARRPGRQTADTITIDPTLPPATIANRMFTDLMEAHFSPMFHDGLKFRGPLMSVADPLLKTFANISASMLWTEDYQNPTRRQELGFNLGLATMLNLSGKPLLDDQTLGEGFTSLLHAQVNDEPVTDDVLKHIEGLLAVDGGAWPSNASELDARLAKLPPAQVLLKNQTSFSYPGPPASPPLGDGTDGVNIPRVIGVVVGTGIGVTLAGAAFICRRRIANLGRRVADSVRSLRTAPPAPPEDIALEALDAQRGA